MEDLYTLVTESNWLIICIKTTLVSVSHADTRVRTTHFPLNPRTRGGFAKPHLEGAQRNELSISVLRFRGACGRNAYHCLRSCWTGWREFSKFAVLGPIWEVEREHFLLFLEPCYRRFVSLPRGIVISCGFPYHFPQLSSATWYLCRTRLCTDKHFL